MKLKNNDIFIVHTPKKSNWFKVIELCFKKGYNWDGADASKYWGVYGENSCIGLDNISKKMSIASLQYYNRMNHTIFLTSDFVSIYKKVHGIFTKLNNLLSFSVKLFYIESNISCKAIKNI